MIKTVNHSKKANRKMMMPNVCKNKIIVMFCICFFRAFPRYAKQTYRSRETVVLHIGVGLSTISFGLHKANKPKGCRSYP